MSSVINTYFQFNSICYYTLLRRSTLGRIFIKWGDKKQYNGAMKMYTLGRMRKYKKGRFKV